MGRLEKHAMPHSPSNTAAAEESTWDKWSWFPDHHNSQDQAGHHVHANHVLTKQEHHGNHGSPSAHHGTHGHLRQPHHISVHHGMPGIEGMDDIEGMDMAHCRMIQGLSVLGVLVVILALVWGYYERKRRRAIVGQNGGYKQRQGDYQTGIFSCLFIPRICFPATVFTPVLAAFNRAEADKRDCGLCDFLLSLKTPITQYQTRQSIRAEYDLEEANVTDCLGSVCCTPCVVAQDALELEHRATLQPAQAVTAVTV